MNWDDHIARFIELSLAVILGFGALLVAGFTIACAGKIVWSFF